MKKSSKNQATKRIQFKIKIKGNGVLNFDSTEQNRIIFQKGVAPIPQLAIGGIGDNKKYSKKNFYTDKNGVLTYKLKISDKCMKRAMKESLGDIGYNANIVHSSALKCKYISHPSQLLGGYVLTKEGNTIKKVSSIVLTEAEQIADTNGVMAMSKMDIRTLKKQKAEKGIDAADTDASDTSMTYIEAVGETYYYAEGEINLEELQFVSCSQQFDRFALNPDDIAFYAKYFAEQLSELGITGYMPEVKYFTKKGNSVEIPEEGILLPENVVLALAKYALSSILNMKIVRSSSGVGEVVEMDIRAINTPLNIISKDNWVSVSNDADITNVINDITVHEYYELKDTEESKALVADAESARKVAEGKANQRKKDEDAAKKAKKAADKETSKSK